MTETARVIKFERGRPEMPSKNGYVMAWRDIKNQSWYGNPECLAVFMHIMLSATSKPKEYNRKGVDLMLKAGQFATSYEDIAEVFDLHKSKVRRFINMFVKSGQLTKSVITQGRINKGLLLSFTNWNKWQKPLENADTQADTQTDTRKPAPVKVSRIHADTQADTQADTVLNNNDLNNNKDHAGSMTQQESQDLQNKGFEHFWKCWSSCKKQIGKLNTAPKAKTFDNNFKKLFQLKTIATMGRAAYRSEINEMCEFAIGAHSDIASKGSNSDFSNHAKMYPALFLSNKQWRDVR